MNRKSQVSANLVYMLRTKCGNVQSADCTYNVRNPHFGRFSYTIRGMYAFLYNPRNGRTPAIQCAKYEFYSTINYRVGPRSYDRSYVGHMFPSIQNSFYFL